MRVRVLHLAETFNNNDFVDVVIRFADKRRFDMMAAVFRKEGNPQLPDYKGEFALHSLEIAIKYLDFLRGGCRLAALLRREKIQILHAHHFYGAVIGMVACILYPACRLVIGRHYHNQFYLTARGLKLRYYLFIESMANRRASAIISPSSHIDDLLREQGVPFHKIRHIHYGFDFSAPKYNPISAEEKQEVRTKHGWESAFLVGNFGRHHFIKGQRYLIESFAELLKIVPNARLVMVGDGPANRELRNIVAKLGLEDKVTFLGWLNEPHKYIASMDVVAHPTLQEAFPQIMIETMALQVPLIITKVSGASDIIRNELNGLLIEPGSTEALSKALMRIASDAKLREALGQQARIDVTRDLRIQNVIDSFEEVYEELSD